MSHNNEDYKRDMRLDENTPPPNISPPPYPHPHAYYPPPSTIKRPRRFWLLFFSFLPGLGHMYMGLIKRGLFYIFALALLVFLISSLSFGSGLLAIPAGFAIAALYAASFFEAFSIRRDIVMGKEVKDTIPKFFNNGKFAAIAVIALIAIVGLNTLSSLRWLSWYVWLTLGIVAVVLAVCATVIIIFKMLGKKSK